MMPDHTRNDTPIVHTDLDLEVAHHTELELLHEVLHLQCEVDCPLHGVDVLELGVLVDGFKASCRHVRLTHGFDLLHSVQYAQLIECAEEAVKEVDYLLTLLVHNRIESTHVAE